MAAKIGFIGAGRMAEAMISGLITKNIYTKDEIVACAKTEETRNRVSEKFGIKMYENASEIAKLTDVLVLAIKPKNIPSLFQEEKLELGSNHLLISIAAGVKIAAFESYVPDTKIIRVMPNHCCMVLEGAAGYVRGTKATDSDMQIVKTILSAMGLAVEVKEHDLDAVTGVSGSSPAFMYMMIDAIADAGVLCGLSRTVAIRLAAQSMLGAGKMALESGMTPSQLVDSVCSPGGTTIEGVKVLEEQGFKSAVVDAVKASVKRSIEMGKK
ncbi:MAG: pyrroline-5-carboxylate reductase [Candidatus Methanomethylophilaceae archaeon]|nr:pyrroline-5-carboxylate reductase [Candidatus Methanomethylophilaceae archaeon]MDD3378378.1 pyrroline-5-carboxylate reductase [Candidatus Methanomethylophilaceae archaeon]MDY0225153.1 pyrroline-5-carboxylate reductase [Candidatus Methanomethylophilaceae archaeon]